MPTLLAKLAAQEGTAQVLSMAADSADLMDKMAFADFADRCGVRDPNALFADLVDHGILIGANGRYYVSGYGRRIDILMRGLDGRESIEEVIRKLYSLQPSSKPYELLTGSLTETFVGGLAARPDFIRLFICSPWIRFNDALKHQFLSAFADADKLYQGLVQIEVITRPPAGSHPWAAQIRESLEFIGRFGATIYWNPALHAKLFIRQPGPRGGAQSAVLGSENLTGSRNIELGIRIDNDGAILRKLEMWFRGICWESSLSGGGL